MQRMPRKWSKSFARKRLKWQISLRLRPKRSTIRIPMTQSQRKRRQAGTQRLSCPLTQTRTITPASSKHQDESDPHSKWKLSCTNSSKCQFLAWFRWQKRLHYKKRRSKPLQLPSKELKRNLNQAWGKFQRKILKNNQQRAQRANPNLSMRKRHSKKRWKHSRKKSVSLRNNSSKHLARKSKPRLKEIQQMLVESDRASL